MAHISYLVLNIQTGKIRVGKYRKHHFSVTPHEKEYSLVVNYINTPVKKNCKKKCFLVNYQDPPESYLQIISIPDTLSSHIN